MMNLNLNFKSVHVWHKEKPVTSRAYEVSVQTHVYAVYTRKAHLEQKSAKYRGGHLMTYAEDCILSLLYACVFILKALSLIGSHFLKVTWSLVLELPPELGIWFRGTGLRRHYVYLAGEVGISLTSGRGRGGRVWSMVGVTAPRDRGRRREYFIR